MLGSQWPGRGSRASVILTVAWRGANVMFVGRPRDGSEGSEGGLGIRRGQFAGDRELAEIRCHNGDWRPSIQQRQGVVVESARYVVRMGAPGV